MATSTYEVRITGDAKSLERALGKVDKSLAGSAKNWAKFAAQGAAIAAVGAAVNKVVTSTVDFDRSMRNVNSIAQLNEKQFRKLEDSVLSLAGPTAQAPKTLADGLYDLVSSGFKSRDALKVLEASARAATAGLTTTDVATKAVAATLNAYKLPAAKAGAVSDALFRTVDRGVVSFEELASTIGDVLPFASSLGVNIQEVGAATATMTKAGISAPETMTRIKNVMVAMLKPSTGLKAAFKDLGVESGEALIKQKGFQGALEALVKTTDGSKKAVAELFPEIRAMGGALALTGKNAKGAGEDLKGMRESAGATEKALSQQTKSIGYWWDWLGVKADELSIRVGLAFQRIVEDVTLGKGEIGKEIKAVVPVIRTLGDVWKRYVEPVIGATIKQLISIIRPFVTYTKEAVGVIVKALRGEFSEAWKDVKDIFQLGIKWALAPITGSLKLFKMGARLVGNALTDVFGNTWQSVRGIFEDGANAAIGVLNSMIRVFNGIPFIPDIGEVGVIGGAGGNGAGRDVNGKSIGRQRGGKMLGGAPSGDSIPAMLERGEYVLNRNAVKAIGTRTLDAVNFGAAPRFQEGGPVRLISGGDVWGAVKDVAGYTPPGLAFKGAKAAFGWAKGFPEVISAISDISGMAGRFPGWVDPSWFINAAIDWLKGKTQKQGRSGSIANAGPLQQFNHTYPKHTLYDTSGKARFSEALTARIASWAGLPGKLFGQIAHGESGFFPGIYGVDPGGASTGYGLWAITAPFNDSRVSKYGGYEQMLNPLKNAKVAKEIYDAQGIGAWYGTQYVTSQRGGRVGMQSGGLAKGSAGRTVAWAQNNLGVTEGSARHRRWVEQTGGVFDPWCAVFVSAAMKAAGIAPPSNPSYSGAFLSGWGGGTNIGRSMSKAIPGDIIVFDKGDGGITDHVGIYEGAGKYISGNMSNAVVEANVADYGTVVGIVRPKYPGATAATAKGGVRKQAKPRKPKFTGSAGGIAAPAGSNKPGKNEFGLGSAIAAPPYGRTRGVVRDIVGPAPVVASEAEIDNSAEERKQVEEEHTAALKEVAAEMKRQTDLAESTIATNGIAALTALGDILKGTLGGSVQQASALAGSGHIGSIGRF